MLRFQSCNLHNEVYKIEKLLQNIGLLFWRFDLATIAGMCLAAWRIYADALVCLRFPVCRQLDRLFQFAWASVYRFTCIVVHALSLV